MKVKSTYWSPPRKIGEVISMNGLKLKISGVGVREGERYYFLTEINGEGVTLYPADVVEKVVRP